MVMESTGDYWKPFYYLLEDAVNVMLVNPRDARNRPGRKTDVSDAAWLADLGAHGLLRASLVPPPPIRRLRDLTRARTDLNRDRVRRPIAWRRSCRTPGSNCPWWPPTSWTVQPGDAGGADRGQDRSGGTGRSGETPVAVEDPGPDRGADGAVHSPSGYLIRMHLNLIDSYTTALRDLDTKIIDALSPSLAAARDRLCSIPGWSTTVR